MTKQNRDRRIENRKLSHINCDVDIVENILGPLDEMSFVAKDKYGFNTELIDIEYYKYGSEEHIQAEKKLRYNN